MVNLSVWPFECRYLRNLPIRFWSFVHLSFLQLIPCNCDVRIFRAIEVEDGTVVDLIFHTNTNISRLHQNDYHIVEIRIPLVQDTYTIHISKTVDLIDHGKVKFKEREEFDCIFSGAVTSSFSNYAGIVSLSSCHHSFGFEGLIQLEDQHYHLAPVLPEPVSQIEEEVEEPYKTYSRFKRSSGSLKETVQSKSKVKHTLKVAKPSWRNKSFKHDTRKVPANKLQEAWTQMLKDQEALQDESDGGDAEDDNNNDTSSLLNGNILDENDKELNQVDDIGEVFAAPSKTKKIIKKVMKVPRVVELAVFTDKHLYQQYAKEYPKNPEAKITKFILATVNNVNYLYAQPSMKEKISFRLVHVGIQKTAPKGLNMSVDGGAYLDSFCTFAGKKDKKGAAWDHALMLTGIDLQSYDSGGPHGLLGIAMGSAMCLRYWSCSLVDTAKGFESAFTAAHEIGHTLGMEHDGEEINRGCNPSKFLMGAMADLGQIKWSQCSNANIKNYLKSGNPIPGVKDGTSIPKCLTKRGSKRKRIEYRTGQFPGQKFNARQQCEKGCSDCTPHVTKEHPYNNICWTLFCKNSASETIPLHPALEGTQCGSNVCFIVRKCVVMENAGNATFLVWITE